MIEIFGYSAIALLIVKYFTPLEPLRFVIITRLIGWSQKASLKPLKHVITVLTCPTCFAFWMVIFMKWNLMIAAPVAILTKIIDLTIEKLQYEK